MITRDTATYISSLFPHGRYAPILFPNSSFMDLV
jgi:hypothetical protein